MTVSPDDGFVEQGDTPDPRMVEQGEGRARPVETTPPRDAPDDAPGGAPGVPLLVSGVADLHTLLDGLAHAQATFIATDQKATLLTDLVRAEARVAALKLRVLATAGDVAEVAGARTPGAWMAAATNTDPRAAHAQDRLARDLQDRWPLIANALASGTITIAQAEVICHALDEVAGDLDRDQLATAEKMMLANAADLDPARLRVVGRHLADLVDPATAQAREAKRQAEAEKRARERARLTLRPQGDGTTRISGVLPDDIAHRLEKNLDAFTQPRKQAAEADGLRAPRHRLMALALGDLLHRINPDQMPHHGGDATTIIVTMTLDQLRGELGAASLGFDESTPITAATARRMACQANLIPWVLGGASQVLDSGRTARLHTPMERKVIRHRDKTCRTRGCTVAAEWCDVHHWTPWARGGKTNVKDAGILCTHHHQRVHDPAYEHTLEPDGQLTFHKRRP